MAVALSATVSYPLADSSVSHNTEQRTHHEYRYLSSRR